MALEHNIAEFWDAVVANVEWELKIDELQYEKA